MPSGVGAIVFLQPYKYHTSNNCLTPTVTDCRSSLHGMSCLGGAGIISYPKYNLLSRMQDFTSVLPGGKSCALPQGEPGFNS